MKKIYFIIIYSLLVTSCDFLDIVPKEVVMEEDIWNDIKNAEKVLAKLYNAIPSETMSDDVWGASDEAWHHWENNNQSSWKYNTGSWGPTDNPLGNWNWRYQDIRRANLFIEHIESVPLQGDQQEYYQVRIPVFKAEARFLRAFYYFDLLKRYGAVPLITESIKDINNTTSTLIERNSVDEIVQFIVNECDDIKRTLKVDYTDEPSQTGRVTRGAALALKSRTLLYAASPLFNGNKLYENITKQDGTPLFSTNYDQEKWKKAADAAEELLALVDQDVYELYQPNPDNPVDNYAQLFYTREWKETILAYSQGNGNGYEIGHFPNGYPFNGQGKMSVLQELVDAYETNTGFPIDDPRSGYTEKGFWDGVMWDGIEFSDVHNVSNMYFNRDPRFYASIYFQYCNWVLSRHKRPVKFAYYGNRNFNNDDSDAWPWSMGTHNMTGYGVRKWGSPEVDILNGTGTARRNIPVFRLAEIYLNYAEALNEYLEKPDQRVYDAVNKVRARVQMPALPIKDRTEDLTKEGMRKRIRNERRVELAFESHRFYDVRRWMIAANHNGVKGTDNGIVYGMNNRPSQEELEATGLDWKSEAAGVAVFYKRTPMQTRVFQEKHYLFPIPKSEIDKNPNLKQNYGW